MNDSFNNKNIVLGITGSIAAYKSAELVRCLRELGAQVRVVMTENGKRFITPLSLQALSGFPVHDDLFDLSAEAAMGHIELARWAEIILVAPASANFIAQLAHGYAPNLLTTLCLATKAPIILAPAMNQAMWLNSLTQTNAQKLVANGITMLETEVGNQACGDTGPGRMLEPEAIIHKVKETFIPKQLSGVNILMTAGPTHESIDPVRYIANGSSGKMGYALARAAQQQGAQVTLVSGPVSLTPPHGINVVSVTTAEEMSAQVLARVNDCDIFMAVAAVSDYRPVEIASQKIHKTNDFLTLQFQRNPDIVSQVAQLPRKPFIVGFAAETEDVRNAAKRKRLAKKMDMIVANYVAKGVGMGSDDNEVTVISEHAETKFEKTNKNQLAHQLINLIIKEFNHVAR